MDLIKPKNELPNFIKFVFTEIDLINSIPVLAEISSGIKTVNNVRDYLFIDKLRLFVNELDSFSKEEIKKEMDRIDASQKYRIKVEVNLIAILDKIYENEKAEYLGKLFKAFLSKAISYEEFLRASSSIEKVFLPDLLDFIDERWDEIQIQYHNDQNEESLLSAGLIKLNQIVPILPDRAGNRDKLEMNFGISKIGKKIREILTTRPMSTVKELF